METCPQPRRIIYFQDFLSFYPFWKSASVANLFIQKQIYPNVPWKATPLLA